MAKGGRGVEKRNDFSRGSVPRTMLRLSAPLIGAQLVNVTYNIVDRIYIGRLAGVGLTALAGVGLAMPVITFIAAFASLAGHGGAPLCSIARGAGDNDEAERVLGNSFLLLCLFGAALTAVGLWIKEPVLRALGATGDALTCANEYLTVYLTGSVFVLLSLGLNPFLSAQGFALQGMIAVGIGAVANIVLDPLFLFVMDMGVKGAALATVISQLFSAGWTVYCLTRKRCIFRLRVARMRLHAATTVKILKLGFSSCVMKLTESAVQLVCNRQLAVLDASGIYLTVMTVINSVRQVIMLAMSGFSEGSQPVMGYNYGAKRYDRVREAFRFMTLVCAAYSLVVWAVCQLWPGALIAVFNSEDSLREAGIPALRMYFATFFMMCLQMAGQFSFVALNKPRHATFFSLLRKAFIVVPLTLILPHWFGVMGVFLAEPVSDAVGSAACYTTFMLTVYRKELRSGA